MVYAEETAPTLNPDVLDFLVKLKLSDAKIDEKEIVTLDEFNQLFNKLTAISDVDMLSELKVFNPVVGNAYDQSAKLTYEYAVKGFVILLGREVNAVGKGGFPTGYQTVASEIGLLKNVSKTKYINRAQLLTLTYNALGIDLQIQEGFGNKGNYNIIKENNLLSEYHNIYKYENILTANYETALSGEPEVKGRIRIGEYAFEVNGTDIEKYLGYSLKIYYHQEKNSDVRKIIYYSLKNNKVLTITSDEKIKYSNFIYTYERNDKEYSVRLTGNIEIVFNGKRVNDQDYAKLVFVPDNGEITFLDNANDGSYDCVFINNYVEGLVEDTNASEFILYLKNNKAISIVDTTDHAKAVKIVSTDGKELTFADIKKNHVVSIAESVDGYVKKVTLSTMSVDGVVEATFTDEDGFHLTIADKDYLVAKNALSQIQSEVSLGDNYKFYLSKNNRIYGYTLGAGGNTKFGYIINIARSEKLDETVSLKLFDIESNSTIIYTLKEKMTVFGQTGNPDVYNLLTDNGKIINTLCRYRVSADGKLYWLDLPTDNNNSLKEGDPGLQMIYKSPVKNAATGAKQGFYLQTGGYMFHQPVLSPTGAVDENGNIKLNNWREGFSANTNTKFLYVPGNRQDEEGYRMKKVSEYGEGEKVVYAYRVGNLDDVPSVVVEYAGNGAPEADGTTVINDINGLTKDNIVYLVEKITTVMDKSGNTMNKIICHSKNGKRELFTKDEQLVPYVHLKEGDVFRYAPDSMDRARGIQVLLTAADRARDDGFMADNAGKYFYTDNRTIQSLAEFRVVFGTAYKKYNASLGVSLAPSSLASEDDLFIFQYATFAKVIVYDKETRTVKSGNGSFIFDYISNHGVLDTSKVFIHTKTGTPQLMIIYN